MSFCINAEYRTNTSRGNTNMERHKGNIPSVLYFSGKGSGAKSISVNGKEFHSFLSSIEKNSLAVSEAVLKIENEEFRVIVKGIQYGIVTYPTDIRHLDFMVVNDEALVNVKVPVSLKNHLSGECVGIQAGGSVRKNIRRVALKGLWKDIPKTLEADMKNCNIGDSVYAGDILPSNKVSLYSIPAHEAIATVDKKKSG